MSLQIVKVLVLGRKGPGAIIGKMKTIPNLLQVPGTHTWMSLTKMAGGLETVERYVTSLASFIFCVGLGPFIFGHLSSQV
jgi:hypothetical protein